MKNKFILGYSIIASIFLIFSVSFFALNLYREYSFGEGRTNTSFIRMVNHVKTASYQNDLYSDTYSSKLVQAIGNFDDIAFLEIKRDGIPVLTYPDASVKNTNSNLTLHYSDKALIRESTLEIEATLYLLKPVSIHYYAKISFLMILIITMITVILIIYIQMKESGEFQTSSAKEESLEEDEDDFDEDFEEDFDDQQDIDIEEEAKTEAPVEDKSEPETEAESKNKEAVEEVVEEAEPMPEPEPEPEPEPRPAPAPITERVHAKEKRIQLPNEEEKPMQLLSGEEPKGLFSPITGLGWEQYLMTRLENEINRAISSEMDLSLFIIQIPDSVRDSEIVKNTANYLSIQFQFKDLLFEYKDDCLVAMKINMNLDEALNFADKLYADIQNILSVDNKKCYIGISTRSIRIVAAERLFTEAEQALEHAKTDDDSPIIAFRADTEKYRQYLEENNI
jgi:GGDEF domain-containing protein